MKLTKKVLLGAAVLAALSFGFMGCKDDPDDDPENAITKDDSDNFTVYYDNVKGYDNDEKDGKDTSLSGVYRAFKRTKAKHLGALTKVTFNSNDGAEKAGKNAGVLGFVWDLQTTDGNGDNDNDKTPETFNLAGVRNYNGKLQAYVSRYYNVSNKQQNNFGATSTVTESPTAFPTDTIEWDITKMLYKTSFIELGDATETSVWIDVVAYFGDDSSTKGLEATLAEQDDEEEVVDVGAWIIAFYTEDPTEENSTVTPVKRAVIPAGTASTIGSGYASKTQDNGVAKFGTIVSQKRQGVYANIYKGYILSGTVKYEDTYHEAEVIEDAE